MTFPSPLSYESERGRQLGNLLPRAVILLLVALHVWAIGDLLSPRGPVQSLTYFYPAQLVVIATGMLCWRAWPGRRAEVALGFDVAYTALLCARVLSTDTTVGGTSSVLALKMVASPLLLPWPPSYQRLSNMLTLSLYAVFLGARVVFGGEPLFVHYWATPLIAAMLSSVGTRRIDDVRRQRFEHTLQVEASEERLRALLAERDDQARISESLVRVGREMISSVDQPALLERLCEVTARELRADFGHTFLYNPANHEYAAVARFGDTPEQWEMLRVSRFPRARVDAFMHRLERDGIAQSGVDMTEQLLPGLQERYGITHAIFILLAVDTERTGILTAGFRGRTEPFPPRDERLAHGIAQIASLALSNALLFRRLERANSVRADFVANMSHELRTPLNVIVGYHDMLLDSALGALNDEQRRVLERLRVHSLQLLDLVGATLDLSGLDAGRPNVKAQPVDVRELVSEVARDAGEMRRNAAVRFDSAVEGDMPVIVTDGVKLRVVLKSLIGNAFKFTEKGAVRLSARAEGDGVELAVSDTGIGITPAAQQLIFEPFRQADDSIAVRYGGVGLGLHIVQRLLELLGGRIWLESELGQGTTFRVWIPRARS